MQPHKIVSHDEWLAARKAHLAEEKAFTRARDALSRKRRELPWEKVEKAYVFEGRTARKRSRTCSAARASSSSTTSCWGRTGKRVARAVRIWPIISTALRSISRNAMSPSSWYRVRRCPEIEEFKARMGWRFQMGVVVRQRLQLRLSGLVHAGGKGRRARWSITTPQSEFPSEERPAPERVSKDAAGTVCHTYSSYGRGLDMLIGAYNFSTWRPRAATRTASHRSMAWVRHHDRYERRAVDTQASYQQPKSASCCD